MEIAITKYTPIFSVLAGAVVVLEVVLGVLGISKRVEGVAVEPGTSIAAYITISKSLRDSASIKLCGYYIFVLARL